MLKQFANVDCSYDLTPDELAAKVSLVDALIVRSATKVSHVDSMCKPRLHVAWMSGLVGQVTYTHHRGGQGKLAVVSHAVWKPIACFVRTCLQNTNHNCMLLDRLCIKEGQSHD